MASFDASRPRSRLRILTLAFLLLCFAAAPFLQSLQVSRFIQRTLSRQSFPSGGSDSWSPWVGARAALHGADPYSAAVTQEIQRGAYGHVLSASELWDPQAFVYPAHMVLLMAPLTLLPWRDVYWLLALLPPAVLVLLAALWLRLCLPDLGRVAAVAVIVLSVLNWPSVVVWFAQQPTLYIALAMALALVLLLRGSDLPAGILLAAATVKPQLLLLLLPWILCIAIAQRRARFLVSFAATLALLLGASFLVVPHWLPHWIAASQAYTRHAGKSSLLVTLFGPWMGRALAALLLIAVVLRLRTLGAATEAARFAYGVALTLSTTLCLIPTNAWLIYNDILLVPAVLLLGAARSSARGFTGVLQSIAGLAVFLALSGTIVCAPLGFWWRDSSALALLPSLLNMLTPLPVAVALLAVRPLPAPPSMSPASG